MQARSPTPVSDSAPGSTSPGGQETSSKRGGGKANVSSACGPCKRAHLACDVARPCKRCKNMGKEELCEDVPHKKRGRPKVPKPAIGEQYHRARPSTADSNMGRWRGPPANDMPYMTTTEMPPQSMPLPIRPPSPRMLPLDAKHELFELFTTTEFKILRATPACYPLTGYHPHEYVNISLLEWIHPADRHFLDLERNRLINVPFVAGPLQSNRETQAAITQLSERELLSPAEGMREPYPNQNVRILRSDNSFDWFNVRLHLGGGLGASLWRSETLGKVYLVVSLLLLRPPPEFINDDPSRRPVPMIPPTPITPLPTIPPQQALPSFSSFAAAAEAPRQRPAHEPAPIPQPAYYPPKIAVRPPVPMPQPQPNTHSRFAPAPPYTRRSQSPTYRTLPPSQAYPEYPAQQPLPHQPQPPQHPQQAYYAEIAQRPPTAPAHPYRRTSGGAEEYARGREGAGPPGDYARRAWEL